MEIELRIIETETERRWNWLQFFDANMSGIGRILGRFLSYRDDETFAWLHAFDDDSQREKLATVLASAPPRRKENVYRLVPAVGSTITTIEECARIAELPLLEIRRYRLAAGTRRRFAEFVRDRTLGEHVRLGMAVYGPFEELDDENVLTWFRGFPDLAERDRRKAGFYQSRLWLEELEEEAFSMISEYSVILATPV